MRTSYVPATPGTVVDPERGRGVALRVEVDDQHPQAPERERRGQVHGGRGLPDAALLVGDDEGAPVPGRGSTRLGVSRGTSRSSGTSTFTVSSSSSKRARRGPARAGDDGLGRAAAAASARVDRARRSRLGAGLGLDRRPVGGAGSPGAAPRRPASAGSGAEPLADGPTTVGSVGQPTVSRGTSGHPTPGCTSSRRGHPSPGATSTTTSGPVPMLMRLPSVRTPHVRCCAAALADPRGQASRN